MGMRQALEGMGMRQTLERYGNETSIGKVWEWAMSWLCVGCGQLVSETITSYMPNISYSKQLYTH